jgi:RNA-directed DNA polymerase
VKTDNTETTPAGVPEKATQAGDIRDRWSWVEPCVWTDRMLTALEQGVKGGKWFSLIDKVYSPKNLRTAFESVKENGGGPGVDHVTVEQFGTRLEDEIARLSEALREGTYRPQCIKRSWIPKPGSKEKRPLGIPTVRDRVVQAALRHVLEPIFERDFATQSYGFRPGRGCKDALRRVDELLKSGYIHVVDADLKSYFDSIPRAPLLARIEEKIADGRVLELLERFLRQEILDGMESWTPEGGTPQGAVISPLLANAYLDPLDHLMQNDGWEMVRYADDFVILCRTAAEAEEALAKVRSWTEEAGLLLHPTKTHIVDVRQPGGFDFLGYHFERNMRWPRKKSEAKLKDAIRAKTRRANGHSLDTIIADVNRTLVGWFEYFKHSHRTTFPRLDGWIRMRLRSILRKRRGGRGRGRGSDHQRWPNAFFSEHGLFTLTTAHAALRQSSRR